MAFFSSTKKKADATAQTASTQKETSATNEATLSHVLKAPRITEKASLMQGEGAYVFNIAGSATKRDVMAAVKKFYGVSPRKVRVVRIPRKEVRHTRTGKLGMTGGGKKAYVHLKSGDTIIVS